jgi:hypothetical protein
MADKQEFAMRDEFMEYLQIRQNFERHGFTTQFFQIENLQYVGESDDLKLTTQTGRFYGNFKRANFET